MDVTNRAAIVGLALVGIFLVFVVIMLAWGAPDESIDAFTDLAGYTADHNNTAAKLLITFGGLIAILLLALVIIYEASPPEGGQVAVAQVGSGEATISTDEVARRVEQELLLHPQIVHAEVTVVGRGKKAEVGLQLHVTAEAELASTTEEACRRAAALLEGRMGVALARPPMAQLHYRELQMAHAEAAPATMTRPVAPPPSTAPTMSAPPQRSPFSTEAKNEPTQASPEDRRPGA